MKRCFIKNDIQMINKDTEVFTTAPRKCGPKIWLYAPSSYNRNREEINWLLRRTVNNCCFLSICIAKTFFELLFKRPWLIIWKQKGRWKKQGFHSTNPRLVNFESLRHSWGRKWKWSGITKRAAWYVVGIWMITVWRLGSQSSLRFVGTENGEQIAHTMI